MGSKDPIQVAREILERDLASTTEQEEILESVEEVEEDIEIVEDDLEEMAHGDKKKKSKQCMMTRTKMKMTKKIPMKWRMVIRRK